MHTRTLEIFYDLINGRKINKKETANFYNTSEKTIQRDLSAIRDVLSEKVSSQEIQYNPRTKNFYLTNADILNSHEVLFILKSLLSSRSLRKSELLKISTHLFQCLSSDEADLLNHMLVSDWYSYSEPQHKQSLIDLMWYIETQILSKRVLSFQYETDKGIIKKYKDALPITLISDAYYFYVVIYFKDSKHHFYNFRLDRFLDISDSSNSAVVSSYLNNQSLHFDVQKLQNENPLMQIGESRTVTVSFSGILEALQDKYPFSKVVSHTGDNYVVSITANWQSLKMWLLSQGTNVKVIGPTSAQQDYQQTLQAMLQINSSAEFNE